MDKKELIKYIDNISLVLISGVLLLFPLFFLTATTDFFVLPRQLLITYSSLALLVLWGAKMILEGKVTFRSSPFNLPMFLFGAIVLISALISVNTFDSLLQSVPVLLSIVFAFLMVNSISSRSSFNIALSSLAIGAVLSSLITILYYAKLYILPFPAIQNQNFTPLGSPIQHIAYLIPILLLSSFFVLRRAKGENLMQLMTKDYSVAIHVVSSILILLGSALTIFKIVSAAQKPIILPMQYGFQIALASVGQDTARLAQSFLFGSGYGTYLTDFSRFRPASFNLEDNIWNLPFSFSSSFALELVATIGVLGILSFLFIAYRLIKTRTKDANPLMVAVAASFIISFLIPYSYVLVTLLFVLLAFYISFLYLGNSRKVYDSSLSLVSLKHGLLSFDETEEGSHRRNSNTSILSVVLAILILVPVAFLGYFTTKLVMADTMFAKSLREAQNNNAQATYDLQREAIRVFPYNSDYYRVFSQINIALANSLVQNIAQGETPDAQAQQNILTLLQQSINSGRAAVSLSPNNYVNWENLARIYRSLVGVGQNAEQFAVASVNQAIALNPTDPRLRIELGGIFYQFGQYEIAQTHFQNAVNLKPDFANGYYNLGHALESKGDLRTALIQYQIVRDLVQKNDNSLTQINAEIEAIQEQIGDQAAQAEARDPNENPQPIGISEPEAEFPPQDPQVPISPPPPTVAPQQQAAPEGTGPQAPSPTGTGQQQ